MRCALDTWQADVDQALVGVADAERLRVIMDWSCGTEPEDEILRRLLIELIGRSEFDPELSGMLHRDSAEELDELREAAGQAGAPAPAFAAEVLFLFLRGFYLASLESPDRWTSERVRPVAARLAEMLSSADAARPGRR